MKTNPQKKFKSIQLRIELRHYNWGTSSRRKKDQYECTIRSKKKQATGALCPLRMAVGSAKLEEFIRYHAAHYVGTVSDWFTDRHLTTDQRRWKTIYALPRSFLVAIDHKFLRRVPYFPLADVITGNYVHCRRVSDSFNEETPSYRRHFTV